MGGAAGGRETEDEAGLLPAGVRKDEASRRPLYILAKRSDGPVAAEWRMGRRSCRLVGVGPLAPVES
jgi:hypothetical protein